MPVPFDTYHRNDQPPEVRVAVDGAAPVVVAITAGKLDFGPWEQIFYGEFDGRRDKRVLIKIIGE